MKTFITSMAFVLGVVASAQDRIISFTELPSTARTFITTNFSKENVSSVEVDDDFLDKDYTVYLNDGTKVEFDSKGNWKEVKNNAGAVLNKIIPSKISAYISQNYPNTSVKEIKKNRYGFEVELINGLDLVFNKKGQFLRIDD